MKPTLLLFTALTSVFLPLRALAVSCDLSALPITTAQQLTQLASSPAISSGLGAQLNPIPPVSSENIDQIAGSNGPLSYWRLVAMRRSLGDAYRTASNKSSAQRTAEDNAVLNFYATSYTVMQIQHRGQCTNRNTQSTQESSAQTLHTQQPVHATGSRPAQRATSRPSTTQSQIALPQDLRESTEACLNASEYRLNAEDINRLNTAVTAYQNRERGRTRALRWRVDSAWATQIESTNYHDRLITEQQRINTAQAQLARRICNETDTAGQSTCRIQISALKRHATTPSVANPFSQTTANMQEFITLEQQRALILTQHNVGTVARNYEQLAATQSPLEQYRALDRMSSNSSDPELRKTAGLMQRRIVRNLTACSNTARSSQPSHQPRTATESAE